MALGEGVGLGGGKGGNCTHSLLLVAFAVVRLALLSSGAAVEVVELAGGFVADVDGERFRLGRGGKWIQSEVGLTTVPPFEFEGKFSLVVCA